MGFPAAFWGFFHVAFGVAGAGEFVVGLVFLRQIVHWNVGMVVELVFVSNYFLVLFSKIKK